MILHIFIGSHGQAVLQDDFDSSMQRDSNEITSVHDQNWLLSPGGVMEQVSCNVILKPCSMSKSEYAPRITRG